MFWNKTIIFFLLFLLHLCISKLLHKYLKASWKLYRTRPIFVSKCKVSSCNLDSSLISSETDCDINKILLMCIYELSDIYTIRKIIGQPESLWYFFNKTLKVHSTRQIYLENNEMVLKFRQEWIFVYRLDGILNMKKCTIFFVLDLKSVIYPLFIITNNKN